MDIVERKKLYEKVYFYELDRRENIYIKLRLPVSILTFMAPVNFFLISKLLDLDLMSLGAVAITIAIAISSIFILGYLSYCIYRVLTGWEYHVIALEDFEKHYDTLVKYYKEYYSKDHNEQELELMAKEIFEKNLVQQLVKYAVHNRNINLARGNYIIKFIEMLPFYLLLLTLLYTYTVPFPQVQ